MAPVAREHEVVLPHGRRVDGAQFAPVYLVYFGVFGQPLHVAYYAVAVGFLGVARSRK